MITLTDMTMADLPLLDCWLHKRHVARWYLHPENWITEVKEQDGAFDWIHHYLVMADCTPIGFCQYYACIDSNEVWEGFSALEGVYSIDYLIGEEDYLGKGLGRQTVCALVNIISKIPNAKMVVVQPDIDNVASRATLLSAAFILNNQSGILYLPLGDK